MMHETGLLSRLIPQFDTLTCKVEYDSYHEYTIDQHILLTLQTADAFAAALADWPASGIPPGA